MLFNSIEFLIFLPLVFVLYWFVFNQSRKTQNLTLLAASYVFYGWWDYRFLALILLSSILDFFIGLSIQKTENHDKRKLFLFLSLFVNLGCLALFKYCNFFIESFVTAFSFFGSDIDPKRLDLILPVGISFYTFQTLSYTIDVYRKKLVASSDIVSFFTFVSFFPQLVAGPIERATNLLPQFFRKRTFDTNQAIDGLRQILWGLVKKVIIADNCAYYANLIFDDYSSYNGSTLVLATVLFAFQIYCDFSGYSDIAIGTARLFSIKLQKNFAFPYFSRDVAEFWRRWHISLSTWFRDYVYIPLGGSKGSDGKKIRNVFIIFLVSGFWHGANWTFIVWGFLNALFFLPMMLTHSNRKNLNEIAEGRSFPSLRESLSMLSTFLLISLTWIFFRSENVTNAIEMIGIIFSKSLFQLPEVRPTQLIVLILVFVLIEWMGRNKEYAIEKMLINAKRPLRWTFYYALIISIFVFGGSQQDFIYFQF